MSETEIRQLHLKQHEMSDQAILEETLVRNINHCMVGFPAELACSAVIKNLEALIVGMAKDKGEAMKFVAKISKHLKREINQKDSSVFGFIFELNKTSNDPILHEQKEE